MTITVSANAPKKTEEIGYRLALSLTDAGIRRAMISLDGEMGVGKTAFTRGFCRAFGISSVKSPTYTVVNEYRGGTSPVFHFDMYRLEDEDDLLSVGYEEYLRQDGFLLAEWSERAEGMLPPDRIRVTICRTDGADGRQITVVLPDSLSGRLNFHPEA